MRTPAAPEEAAAEAVAHQMPAPRATADPANSPAADRKLLRLASASAVARSARATSAR